MSYQVEVDAPRQLNYSCAVHTRLVICLDGIGPEYLAASQTPTFDELGRRGWFAIGQGAMPSVTNVNNVSIVTGGPPSLHGITANYYFDRATSGSVYMESADFILAPTMFEKATRRGRRSAVITSKDKLRTLIARGASEVISAESPPMWVADSVGAPPPILSVEVNHWLFRAAMALCRVRPPDLLYLTLTDYAQHKFAPETEESQANIATLDSLLGDLLNTGPEFTVVAAADHGMRAKTRGLDLGKILAGAGIAAEAIPIIKDRYVAHHQNLGGSAYVYLENTAQLAEAAALLQAEPGVESVWERESAAAEFQLYRDRIGDLFLLASEEAVFGSLPSAREEVAVRSHGCLHTRPVPIIGYGPGLPKEPFKFNYEAASWIEW
ncbi:MAG: alkaline phosphatase family protein [Chloroflexi bacterium]|nr:alkaline phosphatase family protein [Chloroflexota bacterium]